MHIFSTIDQLSVKSKRGLKVVVCDQDDNISKTNTNVAHKKVLQGLWTRFKKYVQYTYHMFFYHILIIMDYESHLTFTYIFYGLLGVHIMDIVQE